MSEYRKKVVPQHDFKRHQTTQCCTQCCTNNNTGRYEIDRQCSPSTIWDILMRDDPENPIETEAETDSVSERE